MDNDTAAADEVDRPPPVRLVVDDDLARPRVTVLFRLILAIPTWIVYALWSIAALFVAIAAWFVLLARGRCSNGIHEFLSAYVRYSVQVSAYLHLTADPYPGFMPKPDYPVRVEIDGPAPQMRWSVFFRLFLALPAFVITTTLGGGLGNGVPRSDSTAAASALGTAGTGLLAAVLGWFASLARGRMPRGLRDLTAYGIGYNAQVTAYFLLLTDRYPSSDPALAGPMELPEHPVSLAYREDLSRPRLLVFFRILLALPHLVWLVLWSVAAFFAAIAGWLAALFLARLPTPLHRFLAAYVRYATHVNAFLYLVGGPFPGFVGAPGSYPVEVSTPRPGTQGRWGIGFRLILAVPALLLASAYSGVATTVGVLGWFSSLARGRMPAGMTRLGAVALRYQAQAWAYTLLVTPRYPYSAPALEHGADTRPLEPDLEPEAA
jgi:hypothetical protein